MSLVKQKMYKKNKELAINFKIAGKKKKNIYNKELVIRLQTHTPLPAEAPSIGKAHPFSKIAVAFEQVMLFECPSRGGATLYLS